MKLTSSPFFRCRTVLAARTGFSHLFSSEETGATAGDLDEIQNPIRQQGCFLHGTGGASTLGICLGGPSLSLPSEVASIGIR